MYKNKFNLDKLFKILVSRTSTAIGEEFVESFVKEIAEFFDADYVLVGKAYDNTYIQTIKFYNQGTIAPNFTYLLENTPCQKVVNGEFCLYPDNVCELFPLDEDLLKLGVEAYIGTPFYLHTTLNRKNETNGAVYGILVIMRKIPIVINEPLLKTFFQAYANRIASEIERVKYEDELLNLVNYDSLTRLHTKGYFVNTTKEFLQKQLENRRKGEEDKKHALMFIDLDNFKGVNDALGHIEGDRCLSNIGNVLNSIVRDDDMVARFGGDEFVLLIRNIETVEDVEAVAKKILKEIVELCDSFNIAEYFNIAVTASIGISIFPNDSTNIEELMVCADSAMYDAKRKGKNGYSVYSRFSV